MRTMRPKGELRLVHCLKKCIKEYEGFKMSSFLLAAAKYYKKALLEEDFER